MHLLRALIHDFNIQRKITRTGKSLAKYRVLIYLVAEYNKEILSFVFLFSVTFMYRASRGKRARYRKNPV